MAGIDSQIIKDYCRNLGDEVKRIYPFLDLYFVVYEEGQRAKEITKVLPGLRDHPAFEEAATLIRFKSAALEHSAFLGIAEGFETSNLGFTKKPRHLAFFTINLADHETEEDLILTVYKLLSQLMDILTGENEQKEAPKAKNSNSLTKTIAASRINLRADLFNILHYVQDGEKNAAYHRAQIRALQALNPATRQRPDEFPFPIALDVTQYAIEKNMLDKDHQGNVLDCYYLTRNLLSSFDTDSLKTWTNFVGPCQFLAWNGYSPSQILGAATLTSPNPFIKATGHLLTEITKITPCAEKDLPQGYNPFVADEINMIKHRRSIEETFEMAMIHSIEADSHLPFLRVANNQNEALMKGHISGWCAHALQSAARAYLGAAAIGVPAPQAARLEFQTCRRDDGWGPLKQLAHHIIELCRNGTEAKTLSSVAKWCGTNPDLKFVCESLNMTISDPNYSAKIKASVEMPSVAPLAPATELIRSLSARNDAPAYVPMPALALGGNGFDSVQEKILLEEDTVR